MIRTTAVALEGPGARDPSTDVEAGTRVSGLAADDGGWVSAVLRTASQLEADLGGGNKLEEITTRLSEAAHQLNAEMVTGASRLGDQLAGAVAGRSAGSLSLWAQNGAHGTVLVVEGLLATGAQVNRAMQRAREAGADRVAAVAVLADTSALAASRSNSGAEIIALDEIVLPGD